MGIFVKTTTEQPSEPEIQKEFEGIITIDDIYPYYKMEQGEIDDDIYMKMEKEKKERIQGIINRLNRSLDEIQPLWPQASKLELYIAFDKSYNDPNQLVNDIEDQNFKEFIKDCAKELNLQSNNKKQNKSSYNSTIHSSMFGRTNEDIEQNEEEDENDNYNNRDDDSDFENQSETPKKWNLRRSTKVQQVDESNQTSNEGDSNSQQANSNTDNDEFSDGDDASDDDFSYGGKGSSSRKKQKKSKKITKKASSAEGQSKRKCHREQENIDLPRPKEIKQSDWETWSFAHKQSYLKGSRNANAYYYRNLKQGEKARNGKWTPEETKLFLNRIKVMSKKNFYDSTPQWGIFSMAIPGRVGYQCANYYRNLVLEGRIYDPRYKVIDGKLKYIAFHQKENKRKGKSKSKSNSDSDNEKYEADNDGDDENKKLSIYERYARENPIIGAIDSITKEVIRVPAISPDGYLLDYNTWLKIITQTGCDPYTRNHLTKRSLVVLNFDNIDQYRDKIKNLVLEA